MLVCSAVAQTQMSGQTYTVSRGPSANDLSIVVVTSDAHSLPIAAERWQDHAPLETTIIFNAFADVPCNPVFPYLASGTFLIRKGFANMPTKVLFRTMLRSRPFVPGSPLRLSGYCVRLRAESTRPVLFFGGLPNGNSRSNRFPSHTLTPLFRHRLACHQN